MRRSKQLIVLHHCLLNQNARAKGLAKRSGAIEEIVEEALQKGWGIYQIPCPELRFLGADRQPLTKTDYNVPEFRRICREIALEVAGDLEEFAKAGYEILKIVGVEGSPSCGVNYTHIKIDEEEMLVRGEGILVEELKRALLDKGICARYYGIKISKERSKG
ncbi:DUF523 domain-containing protein [bacterium]|nr:DUF523 domain-containing protein [bacterium]